MKKLKMLIAALVAVFFAFSGSKALAYDITINPADGDTATHTYEAYQIFTGDLSTDETTLSNITWGDGISTAGQAALQTQYNVASASELAEKLSTASADDAKAFAAAAAQYLQNPKGLTGVPVGYYLVKDKDDSLANQTNGAYTSYILQVVKNVTVTAKASVPTFDKVIAEDGGKQAADYAVGSSVPYQLTATLPSNFDAYKEYYLGFSDTLSSGLTYNNDAKVYLVNGGTETDITSQFTIAADGSSYVINDLKQVAGVTSTSKIVVRYSATLNNQAVIGGAGNSNTAGLTYSNDPNYTGDGSTSPKGETPKKKVVVFTYQVQVSKVDQDNNPLAGAAFTLYKKNAAGTYDVVKVISVDEATAAAGSTVKNLFTFSGLDAGEYKLSETTTPNGYNTIADIEFTITATLTQGDDPALTNLTATATNTNLQFTANSDFSNLSAAIQNKKGSILPSTGSIGTTMLYLVGFGLLLGCGSLFVMKKRAK